MVVSFRQNRPVTRAGCTTLRIPVIPIIHSGRSRSPIPVIVIMLLAWLEECLAGGTDGICLSLLTVVPSHSSRLPVKPCLCFPGILSTRSDGRPVQ
jgi:hypothetical protein